MNTLYLYSLNNDIIRYIDIINRNKYLEEYNKEEHKYTENYKMDNKVNEDTDENINNNVVKYFSTNEFNNSNNEYKGRDGKVYGNLYGFLDMEYILKPNDYEKSNSKEIIAKYEEENLNDLESVIV